MSRSLVQYELRDGSAFVTMNDGKANVASLAMQAQLHSALDRAIEDKAILVLMGRANVFSGGFDLSVLSGGGSESLRMVSGGFHLVERLFSFPMPVIIACTGHAIALGLFILLTGDYRIGADGSYRIGANEVALGLTVPRSGIELMRHRLNPAYLDRAVSLAEQFSATQAVSCGILDEVVPPSEVETRAVSRAQLIGKLDLVAHRRSKLRLRADAIEALASAIRQDEAEMAKRLGLQATPEQSSMAQGAARRYR